MVDMEITSVSSQVNEDLSNLHQWTNLSEIYRCLKSVRCKRVSKNKSSSEKHNKLRHFLGFFPKYARCIVKWPLEGQKVGQLFDRTSKGWPVTIYLLTNHTLIQMWDKLDGLLWSNALYASIEAYRNCLSRWYFTSTRRGIGYSFQLAITAPLYSITGYCIATAQSCLCFAIKSAP